MRDNVPFDYDPEVVKRNLRMAINKALKRTRMPATENTSPEEHERLLAIARRKADSIRTEVLNARPFSQARGGTRARRLPDQQVRGE